MAVADLAASVTRRQRVTRLAIDPELKRLTVDLAVKVSELEDILIEIAVLEYERGLRSNVWAPLLADLRKLVELCHPE